MNWVRLSVLVLILVGLSVAGICLCTTCATTPPPSTYTPEECKQSKVEIDPKRVNAIVPGEKHTYAVFWKGGRAGTAVMEVGPMKKFEGRNVYELKSRTRSTKLVEALYPVRNEFTAYIDTEKFLPVWYEEHKQQGSRKGHVYLDFNRENRWVKTWKWKKKYGKIMRRGLPMMMKNPTHDVLSVVFYCKRIKVEPGCKYNFDVAVGKQIYPMVLHILGIEEIELENFGKRKCFRIKPDIAFEGLFDKAENVDLWVDTEWRIPAKLIISIKHFLGSITFEMKLEKNETVRVPTGEPEEVPKWTKAEKARLAPEPGATAPDEKKPEKKGGGK